MSEFLPDLLTKINFKGIVTEYIAEKLLDRGVGAVKEIFKTHGNKISSIVKIKENKKGYETFLTTVNLSISEKVLIKQLSENLHSTNVWSNEISFNLSKKSKDLAKVFVDLDLYLAPLKSRIDLEEELETIKSSLLIKNIQRNIIVYGGPGAGKTTLMKNICRNILDGKTDYSFSCPIVIRFRELEYDDFYKLYNKNYGLYEILLDTFGIVINYPKHQIEKNIFNEYRSLLKLTVLEFLEQANVLIIFDGFDEIPYTDLKLRIENEFSNFALSIKESRFILTSRNGDFRSKLPNTDTYEICSLNDKQIIKITNNWLGNKKQADALYDKIKNSPYYDTTLRPLTLSHLCAIYERRKSIPSKPRYIYDLVLQLLLELWDEERGIIRPSMYADFYIEKKKEFLAHMAYYFSSTKRITVFSTEQIRLCYNAIYKSHGLPAAQAKKVVNEIESHSGILIQNGYDHFQFSHKSLQEYLTAKYIFSQPNIPVIWEVSKLPEEMAIVLSLSSDPNAYFYFFLNKRKDFDANFWEVFLRRLVEEKPDFNENPIVTVFLLIMMEESDDLLFHDTLFALNEKSNLSVTFRYLLTNYKKKSTFIDKTVYEHKQLRTPLDQRNQMPGRLIIPNDIDSLFFK